MRRARVLIVGCGDVGLRCVARLHRPQGRVRVFALTRQIARRALLRAAGATPIVADLDARASLARLAGLAPIVLHLAPPDPQRDGDPRTRALIAALGARRHSPARLPRALTRFSRRAAFRHRAANADWKGVRRASDTFSALRRISALRCISPAHRLCRARIGRVARANFTMTRRAPRIVYASTTGVYGDCGGAKIDETRRVRPVSARAKRRVCAERQLRRATARGALTATLARVPGIYAANRLPLARLAKGAPALVEADDVYTSHIHADDLAAILVRMMTHGRSARVVHACDDSELKMGDWLDCVADASGTARAPRVRVAEAAQRIDPMALSFMRESRRLANDRLKRELRVKLRYPDVDAFLRTLRRRAQ